jgi:hypothetical protein
MGDEDVDLSLSDLEALAVVVPVSAILRSDPL